MGEKEMNHDLYRNIVFVKFKRYFPEKNEEEINEFFRFNEMEEIFCGYCNRILRYPGHHPYYDQPSVDHKIPLSRGGFNKFENIMICCMRCNVVKGTMFNETYIKMLELLSPQEYWMERILSEIYPGRVSTKMARQKKQAEAERYLHEFT